MVDTVKIQTSDFDVGTLYDALCQSNQTGAVVMFVGRVRDFASDLNNKQDTYFELEHYPGMTEHNLEKIVANANQRWQLDDITVVHRVGKLSIQEQIVFVGVSSKHRAEAFQACDFIMDYLKSRAAFWKKETQAESSHWVDAKETDENSLKRWEK